MMSSVAHFTCRGPLSGQPGQGNLIWRKGESGPHSPCDHLAGWQDWARAGQGGGLVSLGSKERQQPEGGIGEVAEDRNE